MFVAWPGLMDCYSKLKLIVMTMYSFNLKKQNNVEVLQAKISNKFPVLSNLDNNVDINRTLKIIIKYKPWFDNVKKFRSQAAD
jgi:hypothetical protein